MRPADLPRVLSASQASAHDVSRSRMRTELARGQWQPLCRGFVLTRPDPPSRADWAEVGLSICGDAGALSGWDAVRFYGVGERRPPTSSVLVLTRSGPGRSFGPLRIRHIDTPVGTRTISINDSQLPLAQLVQPGRAVVDTAMAYRSAGPVRALVTSAVQRGVCTPEEIYAQVPSVARRGSLLLRRAVVDALDGAMSAAEARALNSLRHADVPPFELNVPLLNDLGNVVAVADFFWRDLRAVLEIDSREFHFSEIDWHHTSDRHNRLTSAGLALTHYAPSRISASDAWLDEVIGWLRRRARELGTRYQPDSRVIRDGEPFSLT